MDYKEVTIISTPGYVLIKNSLFIFSGRKRQQIRQTGQRLIEMDCILWNRVWFKGKQHRSLGITTGLVCILTYFIIY